MIKMGEFEIVKEKNVKHSWRFVQGGNNKTIARSYHEYEKIEDLEYDILVLKDQIPSSKINDDIKKYYEATDEIRKKKIKFF